MHPLVLIALVLFAAVIWVAGILLALIRLADSEAEKRDVTDGATAVNPDKKVADEPLGAARSSLRNY